MDTPIPWNWSWKDPRKDRRYNQDQLEYPGLLPPGAEAGDLSDHLDETGHPVCKRYKS